MDGWENGQEQASERRIGPYEVVRPAGRGGTSTVYEATDTRNGRVVALKVLAPSPHLDLDARRTQEARMEREARAIARLSHPNVAQILDVGSSGDTPETGVHYLVMEFIHGETLRERLDREGALPLMEASRIADETASGLDAIHAAGVTHRDIKPSNIMLDRDGTVKLMDFGVARQNDDTMVTQAGTMIGSPAYMSPEQALGQTATSASDVWSLGVILYEMVVGRAPFAGANIPAVLHEIAYGAAPALPTYFSPAVGAVITHALAREPENRYPSATDLATAFRDAVSGTAAVAAPRPAPVARQYYYETAVNPLKAATPPPAPAPPRRRAATLLRNGAAAAVLFLVLAGALALSISSFRRPAHRNVARVAAQRTLLPASPRHSPGLAVAATKKPVVGTVVSSLLRPTPTPPGPKLTVPVPSPRPVFRQVASLTTPRPAPLSAPVGEVSVFEEKQPVAAAMPPTATPSAAPRIKAHPRITARVSPTPAPATPAPQAPVRPTQPTPAPATPAPSVVAAAPVITPPEQQSQPSSKAGEVTAAPATGTEGANEVDVNPRGLSGLWRGTFSKHAALLVINHVHDDGSFEGSLTVRMGGGSILLAVAGHVSDDASITFKEQRIIDAPGPDAWDLGSETGHIDPPDGMEGEGRDVRGRTYTWSFQR